MGPVSIFICLSSMGCVIGPLAVAVPRAQG